MNLQQTIRRILKEETEDGMKDILFDMFDENTKDVEIYEYEDSLWMMLPEQKEWAFEIQDDLTLYYNYNFFNKIYRYVSLDVTDNEHYITEWVEDILKTGLRHIQGLDFNRAFTVEYILKTGVRHITSRKGDYPLTVKEILKTGKKR